MNIPWGTILTVAGVAVAALAFLWEFVLSGRQRLGYRVQMDTTPENISTQYVGAWNSLAREGTELNGPSVALLRIENLGMTNIDRDDYASPRDNPVGVEVKFPGRSVAGIAITELSNPTLARYFKGDNSGLGMRDITESGRTVGLVELPKVELNRHDLYKVLVVLERAEEGAGESDDPVVNATIRGGVRGGRIKKTESHTGRPRWIAALIGLLVAAVLIEPVFLRGKQGSAECATGQLALVGSTAFQHIAQQAADQYAKSCPGAHFSFDPIAGKDSENGFNYLLKQEGKNAENAPILAFSDGVQPSGSQSLTQRSVAVIVFALVVRNDVDVRRLSKTQIREVFSGAAPTWNTVGGPSDLPVRIIDRPSGSGTRKTFEHQVLGDLQEPDRPNCPAPGQPSVMRCSEQTTQLLPSDVARTPGAIGYSHLAEAKQQSGIETVQINNHDPSQDNVKKGFYPFWQTEYAYTYGHSKPDSLAEKFLDYLTLGSGQDFILSNRDIPCADLTNKLGCRPS